MTSPGPSRFTTPFAAMTVAESHAARRAWNDPALFISVRPETETPPANAGPLAGLPFAVKDNIDVAGLPTTAACPGFSHSPARSATVVEKLVAAGAVPVGKTNLDQFATGLVGVRSPYGVPRNAVRADLIPGGSSSGSASAVAAGIVPFALGTDTAGSGRVPAGLQGLVGLKPSLGLISTRGVLPACRSLDCVSIFARSVSLAFTVLESAAGFDIEDPFSRPLALGAPGDWPPGLRIGVPRTEDRRFFGDAQAEAAFEGALADCVARGAVLVPIDMTPLFAVAQLLYGGPWVAERYHAIRALIEADPGALHPVTRQITEGARKFDAVATFDALYRLAELRRAAEPIWRGIDVLVVPTNPTVYSVAEVEADPIAKNSNLGTYTNFVNLLDLCALAVPSVSRADGVPAGITLIAPSGRDGFLAGLGMALTGETGAMPPACPPGCMEIAVVGAHLSGLPLNGQLTSLGGTFLRASETAPHYRFFRLAGGPPLRPGLVRVEPGTGHAIAVETWALPLAHVGAFLAQIPAPLGLGTLELGDGTRVKGFICEADGMRGATEISGFGGWRAYLASLPA